MTKVAIFSSRVWLVIRLMSMAVATCALQQRAALITGSTDGIGLTTAKHLADKGFDVLIHGRDSKRIEQAKHAVQQFLEDHSNENTKIVTLPPSDISTPNGCMRLVEDVKKACKEESLDLSCIMNNAGVYSEKHVVTQEGLELTFAVNVLAPFVITSHLLPTLLEQPKSRIVVASSISQSQSIRDWDDLHYATSRSYSAHSAYSESKLLDAMLTMEFADRLQNADVSPQTMSANCLDPGTVNTKMLLAGWGPIGIAVSDALDETWLCSSSEVENVSGKYFVYKSERGSSSSYKQSERDKMWSILSSLAPDAAEMWDFNWK